jgi:Histidine phosphatase superfamily (branch 1)
MPMGTIADDIELATSRRPRRVSSQPGVLVVPSGPASGHATGSNRQVAAKPAQIRWTAARWTAIRPNLSSSRLLLLLVRHADAGDKHRWQGPDSLRPLSPAGQAEAAGLVIGLDDFPIGRILTSPTLRCHQTVQPLARDRRLRIERESALGGCRPRPGTGAASGSPVAGHGGVYPRRGDRPCTHAAGHRRVGGRPAVAVAQGVDLAARRGQRTTHPRPLPATAGPGPCPEHDSAPQGELLAPKSSFLVRPLNRRDP